MCVLRHDRRRLASSHRMPVTMMQITLPRSLLGFRVFRCPESTDPSRAVRYVCGSCGWENSRSHFANKQHGLDSVVMNNSPV